MTDKKGGLITRIVRAMGAAGGTQEDGPEESNRKPESVHVSGGASAYDNLMNSVRAAAHRYVQDQVLPICTENEVWLVKELVLTANSAEKFAFLRELEQNRPGEKLIRWFLERVESPDSHFVLAHLQSIRIEHNQTAGDAAPDPYKQALNGGMATTKPALEIAFQGEWIDRSKLPRPPKQEAPIQLTIEDAGGLRVIKNPQLPATLGSGVGVDIPIKGRYVSETHAQLSWRGGRCVFEDLRSTNHTYYGDERLSPERDYSVESKMRLRLGARDSDPAPLSDCPRLIIEAYDASAQYSPSGKTGQSTPIRAASTPVLTAGATPIGAPDRAVIARLRVRDAGGERVIGITATPFFIGRSQGRAGNAGSYVAPAANLAVSGKHMVIHERTDAGVIVKDNAGKNGTWLKGFRLDKDFRWRWGDTLILGGKTTADPHQPVEITLLKPESS